MVAAWTGGQLCCESPLRHGPQTLLKPPPSFAHCCLLFCLLLLRSSCCYAGGGRAFTQPAALPSCNVRSAGAIQALGKDDGSGAVLAKASLLLRLHFSYITEAVQNMARKPLPAPAPPPPPVAADKDWSAVRQELRATVGAWHAGCAPSRPVTVLDIALEWQDMHCAVLHCLCTV